MLSYVMENTELYHTAWYYFLLCIDEPRCAEDLSKLCNCHISYVIRYFPREHLKRKLIELVDVKNRKRYFRTIFDSYFDFLQQIYPEEERSKDKELEFIDIALKDKEKWINYWNNSESFRKFCSADIIIQRLNTLSTLNPIKKKIPLIPIHMTIFLITLHHQIGQILQLKEVSSFNEDWLKRFIQIALFFLRPSEAEKEMIYYVIRNYQKISEDFEKYGIKETALYQKVIEMTKKESDRVFSELEKL